ncbi:MAG: hypothetical protein AB8E15_12325 [Bdellovibrionales bacterium]
MSQPDNLPEKVEPVNDPIPSWSCELNVDPIEGSIKSYLRPDDTKEIPSQGITVGQEFKLNCSGESVFLDPQKINIELIGQDEKLNDILLKKNKIYKISDNNIEMGLVSYKTGEINTKILVTDGQNGFVVKRVELVVESLLAQQPSGFEGEQEQDIAAPEENLNALSPGGGMQQGPKPYPAFGPVGLEYPLLLWILVGIAVLIALASSFGIWRYFQKRKKLVQKWEEFHAPIGNQKQFHQDLRIAERRFQQDELSSQDFVREMIYQTELFLFRTTKIDFELGLKKQCQKIIKKKILKLSDLKSILKMERDASFFLKLDSPKKTDAKIYLREFRKEIDRLHLKSKKVEAEEK